MSSRPSAANWLKIDGQFHHVTVSVSDAGETWYVDGEKAEAYWDPQYGLQDPRGNGKETP